jgi:hypothetical protein
MLWAASVWKAMPWRRVMAPIWASGWIVPISLLACITDTRIVRVVMACSTSAGSTRPTRSTGR